LVVTDTLVLPILDAASMPAVLVQLMDLLQSIVARARESGGDTRSGPVRVLLLTSGAEGPDACDGQWRGGTGAAWGLARTARIELGSQVSITCVDTDAVAANADSLAAHLRCEIEAGLPDAEVAYRDGARHVRRMKRGSKHTIGPVSLQLDKRGSLQDLQVAPALATADNEEVPVDDRIEVMVCTVGLNFKDLLNVIVPDEAAYVGRETPPLPGADFAGVVTAVSAGSPGRLRVGDRVFGMCGCGSGALHTRVIMSSSEMAQMPSGWSFEEAAPLPMVFMTVEYALNEQVGLALIPILTPTCIMLLAHSCRGMCTTYLPRP
jgi:polyketide synthase 12